MNKTRLLGEGYQAFLDGEPYDATMPHPWAVGWEQAEYDHNNTYDAADLWKEIW